LIEPRSLATASLKNALGTFVKKTYTEPSWLAVATREQERGVREERGLDHNSSRILEYLAMAPTLVNIRHTDKQHPDSPYMMNQVDETAWCAGFVKWCLEQAGVATRGLSAQANAWRHFGEETTAREGAITVIHRTPFGDSGSGWHVGFYIGGSPDAPALLGGNQDNRVGFSQYFDLKEAYFRWPSVAAMLKR
jgi:uncharacterized protein (TIGR02594 family)